MSSVLSVAAKLGGYLLTVYLLKQTILFVGGNPAVATPYIAWGLGLMVFGVCLPASAPYLGSAPTQGLSVGTLLMAAVIVMVWALV